MAAALAGAMGCDGNEPLVRGETIVVIDTDLPVPDVVTGARVDVYAEDGTWLATRDVVAGDPSNWPISFGIAAGERPVRRLVRVRVFPWHRMRDYTGAARIPAVVAPDPREPPSNLDAMCGDLQELVLGREATLRYGRTVFTSPRDGSTCQAKGTTLAALSGAGGLRVTIVESGSYRFEVTRTVPDRHPVALLLRRDCADPESELACAVDTGATLDAVQLEPGTYTLIATSNIPQEAEVRVLGTRGGKSSQVGEPSEPVPAREPTLPWPRLVSSTRDETPSSEPREELTAEVLGWVDVVPGRVQNALVVAGGACIEKPAALRAKDERRLDLETALACNGGNIAPPPVLDSRPGGAPSLAGRFSTPSPCAPTRPDRVCVGGGMFVMGSDLFRGTGFASSAPERIVRIETFYVDRDEVSVAEYRAQRAAGWTPKGYLGVHDGALGEDPAAPSTYCTISKLPMGREDYPLNCASWELARDYCQFRGGDLPTEAMWEYMAKKAGRSRATLYPWGDDDPTCARAVHDRAVSQLSSGSCGAPGSDAPVPRSASEQDVTPLGIRGLGGSLGEWCRDTFASYDAACWRTAPLDEPVCDRAFSPLRSVRGGDWVSSYYLLASALRDAVPPVLRAPTVGFRCVYPGP